MAVKLELPRFDYFQENNVWTGSMTKDREQGVLLRARIAPDKEAGILRTALWKNEDVCFELSQTKEEREYPLSAEAVEEIRAWLLEEYASL